MTGEVDLRGFHYSLEPVLQRQQWDLDALQLKLGRLDKAIGDARREQERCQAAYSDHAREMRKSPGVAFEPSAYARAVSHLARLHADLAGADASLEQLRQQRRSLQEDYVRIQVKVNLTSSHKEECLKEYVSTEQNRLGSERDRDWLARNMAVYFAGEVIR